MNSFKQAFRPPGGFPPALVGKIVVPEDARFDEARLAWNLAIDQQPAAVVFPESAEDVTAAVLFAAERGQRIAPQGTGHGAAALGSLGDTILLKTEAMRGLAIDPVERIARAEAGVLSLELIRAAAQYGLTPLVGTSPDVGVVGYTLGGGLSFLGRKYGLAANSVRAIELVTADGSLVRGRPRARARPVLGAAWRWRQLRDCYGDRARARSRSPTCTPVCCGTRSNAPARCSTRGRS